MQYIFKLLQLKTYKLLELFVLGFTFPVLVMKFKLASYTLIILWIACLYCVVIYRLVSKDDDDNIFKWKSISISNLLKIFLRWGMISCIIFLVTFYFFNDKLFFIQKNNPEIIWKILILYPLVSALPQEFIFCTFFFKRYETLFINKNTMILMSSLTFSLAHLFFINYVAPFLGFFAGLIFAWTFSKYRSLALVAIEHGLYGNTIFLLGLGWYFWGGAVSS